MTLTEADFGCLQSLLLAAASCHHLTLSAVEFSDPSSARFVLGLAPALLSLTLHRCELQRDTFVELLSRCLSLERLTIRDCSSSINRLLDTDADARHVKLANVKTLHMPATLPSHNSTFQRILNACPNVVDLSLQGCRVGTDCKDEHSSLVFDTVAVIARRHPDQLTRLNLSGSKIDDSALQLISDVGGLRLDTLRLCHCAGLTDAGMARLLSKQTAITHIDVSHCAQLGTLTLRTICTNLPGVRHIGFAGRGKLLDPVCFSLVRRLSTLVSLDVASCRSRSSPALRESLRAAFRQGSLLRNVTGLNLSCVETVDDTLVTLICEFLPKLVHFDVSSCFEIGDVGMLAIVRHLTLLKTLRLAWCKRVTDDGLMGYGNESMDSNVSSSYPIAETRVDAPRYHNRSDICRNYRATEKQRGSDTNNTSNSNSKSRSRRRNISDLLSLRRLDLTACSSLTDKSIAQCIRFSGMQSLSLTMCPLIGDGSLRALARNVPALEELYLSKCHRLTDCGVDCVVNKLPRLRVLDISGCELLTDRILESVKRKRMGMRILDVSFCDGITERAVDTLAYSLPRISIQKRHVGKVTAVTVGAVTVGTVQSP